MDEDKQEHLLECLIVKLKSPEIFNNESAKYKDIYCDDPIKQNEAIKLIESALRIRIETLDK